jgi:integrase
MAKNEYLLQKEVDLILSALTPENRLVMRTALVTGLRVGDVLALKPERLKPHFWVTEQKTGKKRQVGLPEPLLSDLRKQAGKYWVFPGRDPRKHRTRQAVWKDVKRAARAFRLPQNVGPHSARKVYAVDLMRKYGDIERVKRALNHSSETVTMIYALADMQLAAKNKRRRSGKSRSRS